MKVWKRDKKLLIKENVTGMKKQRGILRKRTTHRRMNNTMEKCFIYN
jgi:hypothetical protein